jgi:hypothetical protein
VSTSMSAGMEQPRGLRTGSTIMIDIVLATLSHTDLQIRGLGLPTPWTLTAEAAHPEPMSQSNRADGIEMRR